MTAAVRVLGELELCLLAYSGKLAESDFGFLWETLQTDESYHPDFDDLVLVGPDADFSDIAYKDAKAQASKFLELHGNPAGRRLKRVASVCASDVQMAMMRMFRALLAPRAFAHVELATFDAIEPAIRWLEPSKNEDRRLDRDVVRRSLHEMGHGWCYDAKRRANGAMSSS